MDPIAVDAPVKTPPVSGVSGVAGLGARPPVTVATPPGISAKVDALLRSEPGKPPATPPAATSPTTTPHAPKPADTPTSWLGKVALVFGLQPTKRQAVIAASAAVSLAVGVGVVKTLFPGAPATKPDVALGQPLAAEAPKPPSTGTTGQTHTAPPHEPRPTESPLRMSGPLPATPSTTPVYDPASGIMVPPKPPGLSVEPAPTSGTSGPFGPANAGVIPAGGPPAPIPATLPAASPVALPAVQPIAPVGPDGFKPAGGSGGYTGSTSTGYPDYTNSKPAPPTGGYNGYSNSPPTPNYATSPPTHPTGGYGGSTASLPAPAVNIPPLPGEVSPAALKSEPGTFPSPVELAPAFGSPSVVSVSASEPAKSAPPPSSLPAIPAGPAIPLPGDLLPAPALPIGPTPPTSTVPPVGPTGGVSLPAPVVVPPIGPPAPVSGKPVEGPSGALPAPPVVLLPGVTPMTPAPPSVTLPTGLVPPASIVAPPSMLPPSIEPVRPTVEFVKPAGTTEVKPLAGPERAATTSFDVDLHEPKSGDTYETISREFYNDTRYAAALRAYNRNQPIPGPVRVEVPPIHVLKKQFPQVLGATTPAARTADGWGPAGATAGTPSPVFRASGPKTFTVPAGGMSLGTVAREALGNATRWQEIYDLNPQVTPDNVPAGTVLKLPDAKPT